MNAFIAVGLKGSILMTAAAAVGLLLYRASAATRHVVWTLSIAGLLLLPLATAAVPDWQIAVPVAAPAVNLAIDDTAQPARSTSAASPSLMTGAVIPDEGDSRAAATPVPWNVLPAAICAITA